jgi:membrane protease YdiL (CAAX protease family)
VDPASSSPSPDHLPEAEKGRIPPPDSRDVPEPEPRRASAPEAEPLPPRWGLGDFVWIYVAGIVASAIFGQVGVAITGDTSGHIGALTLALSAGGQFGTWFGCTAFVARAKGSSLRADFGFRVRARDWWVPFAGVGIFLIATVLILPLVNIANAHQQVVNDLDNANGLTLAVFAVIAVMIAPLCEELLFRGLLLRSLRRRMSPEWAVIVQALAFALAHPMLSPTIGDLAVVPALFLLGAISGMVALRRGDLSPSILMHVGFNLLTTIAAL